MKATTPACRAMRALVLGCAAGALIATASLVKGDDKADDLKKLPSIKELPDPFRLNDGSRVATPADWPRRRGEILELVQRYEYGHLPPAPAQSALRAEPAPDYLPHGSPAATTDPVDGPTTDPALPEGTRRETLLLTITGPAGKTVCTHLMLSIPPGPGPFPTIIRGDLGWGNVKPAVATEVARRGYVLVSFDRTEIAPDKNGPRTGCLYDLYPDGDFGAVAAWAWGFHRVVDYLLTRPEIDPAHLIVTGHSRGAKAALLAGATDERIALTAPNCSGCGGAGCFRLQAEKSEDIGAIVQGFPYWFARDFRHFVGHVDQLPFDQHEVKALVAPRLLLTNEALGDLWANPHGTQQSHLAAKEVFAFLGVAKNLAIHYRPGKHEFNLADWKTLLDFADAAFFQKQVATRFNELPFPTVPKPYAWAAPRR